jgi:hypothetical protein
MCTEPVEGTMRAFCKEASRILLLLALVLFAVQFVRAGSAPAAIPAGNSLAARQVAQKPLVKTARAARQQPQATPAEAANDADAQQQDQANPDVQRQLADLQRRFEDEALDRIRNGGPPTYHPFNDFINQFVPFLVFIGVTLALLWILRTVLDNRRWNKMVKVQTETHAKLLDRFSSSQEMLAYMQSEAGKKFLEAPVFEGQRRQVSTLPFGRILWSIQIGIVAGVLGIGFLFLRGRVSPDANMGFQIFGTLVLALGIGFLVSGGVSYLLAKHFGLLERHDELARSGHNA